jgi:hypothetical protein|tara:strand:+ start:1071 stop:1295 length:225 start_codon:yes stop_codon:yes gene_type:complete
LSVIAAGLDALITEHTTVVCPHEELILDLDIVLHLAGLCISRGIGIVPSDQRLEFGALTQVVRGVKELKDHFAA